MEVVWHAQALGAVPASSIQNEHDLLGRTRMYGGGKGGEFGFEEGNVHRRRQVKDRAPLGGMDEPDEIAPVVAMLNGSQGTLPGQSPDFAQDGLQANAVFIHGPELDDTVRKCRGDLA